MYTPKDFRVDDLAECQQLMAQFPFATLVTPTPDGLVATHLPLYLEPQHGPCGTLYGHVSRANLQWQRSDSESEALAIFAGLDSYISPSWYAAKQQTGRVVPTWNYTAVHVYGKPRFFDDPAQLRTVVTHLTERHEQTMPTPWQVADAPESYVEAQLKAIIGVELPIARLEAKRKYNQNRSAEDRAGVIAGLRASDDPAKAAVASLMQQLDDRRQR
ncbi:MAG: FMN-binding negative transcriptional regulator [Acidobacteriota bacterium]|nr:FMN-binding negative transcriptional regulator [Acidobacteriota bacterium]